MYCSRYFHETRKLAFAFIVQTFRQSSIPPTFFVAMLGDKDFCQGILATYKSCTKHSTVGFVVKDPLKDDDDSLAPAELIQLCTEASQKICVLVILSYYCLMGNIKISSMSGFLTISSLSCS